MMCFIFKRQIIFVMFVLFGCLAVHATDDDLVTEQVIIRLDKAGTLSEKIGEDEDKITNLKILGEIGASDLGVIREMARSDQYGQPEGNLRVLDLSEVKVVDDRCEFQIDAFRVNYTSNDCLGDYAFYDCGSLTCLKLPSSITSIGKGLFSFCRGLTSLDLPSGITSIGDEAFGACNSLTSLDLPSGITSIGDEAFSGCGLTSLELPSGILSIGDGTFRGCDNLTSLAIPFGVTSIGDMAFGYCFNLASLNIPSSVTSIGSNAFYRCSSLTRVC